MLIAWSEFSKYVIQAVISLLFGALGAYWAFRLAIERERRAEEREQIRRLRQLLLGGEIPYANPDAVVRLFGERTPPPPPSVPMQMHPRRATTITSGRTLQRHRTLLGFFIVKTRQKQGAVYEVKPGMYLGGDPVKADLTVSDPGVSPVHAQVVVRNEEYAILDLNSVQGTYLNGERVERESAIHEDDEIKIGDTVFVFKTLAVEPTSEERPVPSIEPSFAEVGFCEIHGPYNPQHSVCPYCETESRRLKQTK